MNSGVKRLNITVMLGGPSAEREVSLVSGAEVAKAMAWVNGSIQVTLFIFAVAAIGDAIREIRRLLRGKAGEAVPVLSTR